MKSILVIDTPKNCEECPLCLTSNKDTSRCFITYIAIEDLLEDKDIFEAHCPLKPLPQKYDEGQLREQKGWNNCLKEITGEEKWKIE